VPAQGEFVGGAIVARLTEGLPGIRRARKIIAVPGVDAVLADGSDATLFRIVARPRYLCSW
jgi:hypothetical protein